KDALAPHAIYLHPGEPVYEAVVTLLLGRFGDNAERGAAFLDPAAKAPYLFYLAKVPVVRERLDVREGHEGETATLETVDETMVGVRRLGDGRCEEAPPHLLMELFDASTDQVEAAPAALIASAADAAPVEAYIYEQHGTPLLDKARQDAEER